MFTYEFTTSTFGYNLVIKKDAVQINEVNRCLGSYRIRGYEKDSVDMVDIVSTKLPYGLNIYGAELANISIDTVTYATFAELIAVLDPLINFPLSVFPPYYSTKVIQYLTSTTIVTDALTYIVDRKGTRDGEVLQGACYDFGSDATATVEFDKADIDLSGSTYECFEVDFEKQAGEVCVIDQGDNSSNRITLTWYSDNAIYFFLSNGSTSFGTIPFTTYGKHTIKAIFDGAGATNADKCKIWIDSGSGFIPQVLTFGGTIPTSMTTLTNPMVFGYYRYAAQYADGYQGNIRRYNAAGELINWWQCAEGSKNQCLDARGGTHGTIINATLANFHATSNKFHSYANQDGYSEGIGTYTQRVPLQYSADGTPTLLDIFGNTPTYLGEVRRNVKVTKSNCLQGTYGSAKYVETGHKLTGGLTYRFPLKFKTPSSFITSYLFSSGGLSTAKGMALQINTFGVIRVFSSDGISGNLVTTTIGLSVSTFYEGEFIYYGLDGSWSLDLNGESDSGVAEMMTWTGLSGFSLEFLSYGASQGFGGIFSHASVIESGTKIIEYQFSEGEGNTTSNVANPGTYDGQLVNFTTSGVSSDWIQDDGATDHNLTKGFDKWQVDASPGTYVLIPYDVNGNSILTDGDTFAGHTWQSTHPKISGKQFHNGSENGLKWPICPELKAADTDGVLFTGDTPNELFFTDLQAATINPIFLRDAIIRLEEFTLYDADLTGAELTAANTYFNI